MCELTTDLARAPPHGTHTMLRFVRSIPLPDTAAGAVAVPLGTGATGFWSPYEAHAAYRVHLASGVHLAFSGDDDGGMSRDGSTVILRDSCAPRETVTLWRDGVSREMNLRHADSAKVSRSGKYILSQSGGCARLHDASGNELHDFGAQARCAFAEDCDARLVTVTLGGLVCVWHVDTPVRMTAQVSTHWGQSVRLWKNLLVVPGYFHRVRAYDMARGKMVINLDANFAHTRPNRVAQESVIRGQFLVVYRVARPERWMLPADIDAQLTILDVETGAESTIQPRYPFAYPYVAFVEDRTLVVQTSRKSLAEYAVWREGEAEVLAMVGAPPETVLARRLLHQSGDLAVAVRVLRWLLPARLV